MFRVQGVSAIFKQAGQPYKEPYIQPLETETPQVKRPPTYTANDTSFVPISETAATLLHGTNFEAQNP